MTVYLILKYLHAIGAAVLLGTGAGIAFFMLMAHRTGDVAVIAGVARIVVVADYLFTATAVVAQPVTGLLLAHQLGYSRSDDWILASIALYLLTGAFWLPVVWMQTRMRDMACAALANGTPLPPRYHLLFRRWFAFGFPAFGAVMLIYWLMIARPETLLVSREPGLRGRLLIGAIAGVAGVLATTYAMNELHRRRRHRPAGILPAEPPPDEAAIDAATAAQVAYGAACGTLLSAVNPRVGPVGGALAGAGLWVVSRLGWLPGMDMVRPAALLPGRRNAYAIGIHLIWGAATALALRDLLLARGSMTANEDRETPER